MCKQEKLSCFHPQSFQVIISKPLFFSKKERRGEILRRTEAEEVRDSSAHRMKGTKEMPGLGYLTVLMTICEFA